MSWLRPNNENSCLNKKQALKRLDKAIEASSAVEQVFINESILKSNKS